MAKGRIVVPPKVNLKKNIENIVKQGAKTQPKLTLAKTPAKSFVQKVQASKTPTPSQNQRGRIKSKSPNDLTK